MKKLLSIVLALALVLGTLPVFADANPFEQEGKNAGENLMHHKVIAGDNGDLKLDRTITRMEIAKILASINGKEAEAEAHAAELGYVDADQVHDWAKGFVAYAKTQGWMKGNDKNEFMPMGEVSGEELAVMLLRALGYEEAEWGKNIDSLKELTGIAIPQGTLNRGQVFDAVWPAFSTPVMKDGNILGVEKGVLENPVPPVVALEVNNVSADNLKEIKVVFNQPVKEVGEFAINNKAEVETAKIDENNNTVVILTVKAALTDQKEYTLTSSGTKAVADVAALDKVETKFTPLDKERPVVEKVEFTGPKHITITFNEPIDKAGKVEILQGKTKLGVDNTNVIIAGNKATVKAYSNFKQDSVYTFTVSDYKDYNALKNIEKDFELTYTKDTTSPDLEVVEIDQRYLVVEFSKPVSGLKPEYFHHTFTKYEAEKITAKINGKEKSVVSSDEVTRVKIHFHKEGVDKHQALPEGQVKVMIDGKKIADLYGNKLGDKEFSIEVVADKEAPTVESVVVYNETTLIASFSKEVAVDFKKSFDVRYDGKSVFKNATLYDTGVYLLEIKAGLAGKTVTVEIDKVTDTSVNKNKLSAYSEKIEISDKTPPTINNVTYKKTGVNADGKDVGELYIMFNEDVDGEEAHKAANYSVVNGATYTSLSGPADFFNDNSIVVIELNASLFAKVKAAGAQLAVENVKDIAGNKIAQRRVPISGDHSTVMKIDIEEFEGIAPAKYKVVATAVNKVVVTFNQNIYQVNKDKVTIAGGVAGQGIESAEPDGNTVVITLKKPLQNANGSAAIPETVAFQKDALRGAFTGDSFNDAPIAAKPVYNKIIPSIVKDADDKITGMTATKDNSKKIEVAFTRELPALNGALTGQIFKVYFDGNLITADQYTVALKVGDAKVVEFDFSTKDYKNAHGTFKIELVNNGGLVAKDNSAVGIEAVAVADFVAELEDVDFKNPTVTSISADKKDNPATITIVFSEKVDETSAENVTNYVPGGGASFEIDTAELQADGKTVVVKTKTAAMANSNTLTVQNIKDLNANVITSITYTITIDGTIVKFVAP